MNAEQTVDGPKPLAGNVACQNSNHHAFARVSQRQIVICPRVMEQLKNEDGGVQYIIPSKAIYHDWTHDAPPDNDIDEWKKTYLSMAILHEMGHVAFNCESFWSGFDS